MTLGSLLPSLPHFMPFTSSYGKEEEEEGRFV